MPRITRWFVVAVLLAAALVAQGLWWMRGQPVAIVDAPPGKIDCVSYAPYLAGQSPLDELLVIPRHQIEADLRALSERVACVRTYATNQGLAHVVPVAAALGMEVILGAWVGREAEDTEKEVATAVRLANEFPQTVKAIVVGNEVLLRGELPPAALSALIRRVKQETAVPVTYADVWEFWLQYPEVAAAVDFITIHILPYWEDDPVAIEKAVDHILDTYRLVGRSFPDREILIGETGWPSVGRMRDGALPSRVNQARFVRGFLEAVETKQIPYNLIEAFDQPWKRELEGAVGGYWGLFSVDRTPKFPLRGPVREDPHWLLWLAAGGLLGLLPLVPTLRGGWRRSAAGWIALLAGGQATGGVLMMQVQTAYLTSRTPLEWSAAVAVLLLSAVIAWILLQAIADRLDGLARDGPGAGSLQQLFAWIRNRRSRASLDRPALLAGLRFIALFGAAVASLYLVFDARYRAFPIAGFAIPAVGFALLALLTRSKAAMPEDATEETWLAGLLAVAGLVIAANEGLANTQALAWTGTTLLLAAPRLMRLLRGRRALRRSDALDHAQ